MKFNLTSSFCIRIRMYEYQIQRWLIEWTKTLADYAHFDLENFLDYSQNRHRLMSTTRPPWDRTNLFRIAMSSTMLKPI